MTPTIALLMFLTHSPASPVHTKHTPPDARPFQVCVYKWSTKHGEIIVCKESKL
jgi:hypothetical protein